jgi:hypothetical protein
MPARSFVPRAREKEIADALSANTSIAKIKADLGTSQRTIERVRWSILSGAGIPPPLKVCRPTKMLPDVIEQVQNSTTADPYLGSHR